MKNKSPKQQTFLTMTMRAFFPLTVSALFSTVVLFLGLTLLLLLCVIKKRMEGTYRPSAEERKPSAAGGSEKNGLPFPLPKEERLI
uniref:Crumbs homolog 3b n=1 Tax=Hippocampus comes TaxID=109280 RepID=A0A3Q2YU01_HIPCM